MYIHPIGIMVVVRIFFLRQSGTVLSHEIGHHTLYNVVDWDPCQMLAYKIGIMAVLGRIRHNARHSAF